MLTFTVNRTTEQITAPIILNFTVGGTATFGTDYTVSGATSFTATTATLTIPASATQASIVVTPIADAIFEGDETVILTLIASSGAQLGLNTVATGTILNDDAPAFVDPYDANVVFFANFTGADNSTTFTDTKGNVISVRSGTPKISTAQSITGNGSLYLDGASALTIAASPALLSQNNDYDWEICLYPTAFSSGVNQGIVDQRLSASSSAPEAIIVYNTSELGTVGHFTGATALGRTLELNQWQVLRVSRYQGIKTIYLDNIPVYSGIDTMVYTEAGSLLIGDIQDTNAPFGGMFTGYIQYVRKTIRASRRQGYGALNLAINDADPLDAFKVLDINCDSGTIVDTKGHVITPTGAVAYSTAQKRSGVGSIALTSGHLDVVGGGSDFDFGTAPYSIATSVRLDQIGSNLSGLAFPNYQYLWDFDGGNTSSLFFTANAGQKWAIYNGLLNNSYSETPVANTWYDIALAKIDTKYLLIRNNQVVAASNNAPATANYSAMRLGNYRAGGPYQVEGFMDSVSVYKGIANGSNLTHTYTLRFLTRFSGSSLNDELGAIGSIVGTAPTFDTANKRSLDASALFTGTGHITYAPVQLGADGYEIAGWIKGSTTQVAYAGLICIGETTGTTDNQSWSLFASVTGFISISGRPATNKLALFVGAVSTSQPILASTTSFDDGLPHYWRIIKYVIGASACTVMVVDGKIEDVYVGAYAVAPTTRPMLVGSNGYDASGRRFTGNQDDVAIYTA